MDWRPRYFFVVLFCCAAVVVAADGYDIVLGNGIQTTLDPNQQGDVILDELAILSPNSNISCYCSPENTTVACNDTDVEPLQESSLIPDNAQFLYISSNRINYDHIGQGNFSRTLNITEIILRNCGVAEILPASFRPLKALKHFELAENARPVVIRDDAFAGADMESVVLHKLQGGLSTSLNSFRDALIRTLMMVLCRLGEIPHLGHDSMAESLAVLYLSHNNIREVRGWSFTGLKSLRQVYLDNNAIADLLPHAFAGITLQLLDLSRNRAIRIHRSSFLGAKITKLLLSDCRLTKLEPSVLSPLADTLIELDLSGNGIIEVEPFTFAGLGSIRFLDLSNNTQMVIQPKSFAFSKLLTRLDLSDCPLLTIKKGAFCRATVEELAIARSSGLVDFNQPTFLVPLMAPQPLEKGVAASAIKPTTLRMLDASQNAIRMLTKSEHWKLTLSTVSDEIRLTGNPISCSDPQTAILVSRYKEKLVDICPDLRKYALLMPQMHSELTISEMWLSNAVNEECRDVFISEAVIDGGGGVDYESSLLNAANNQQGAGKTKHDATSSKPSQSQRKTSLATSIASSSSNALTLISLLIFIKLLP